MGRSARRGSRRAVLVPALSLSTMLVASVLGATASAGAVTVESVLKTIRAAVAAQPGVHVAFVATSGTTSTTEKITADAAVSTGMETVSVANADLSIRVTPTDGFVRANSSGFVDLFGFSSAQAKKAGSDWVSFKAGTSQYSNLRTDVTLRSVTALLPKAKGTKLSSARTGGIELDILKWTSPATSSVPKLSNTLTASADTGLPIEVTSVAADGTKSTTRLSRWGEPVLVTAPPPASSIASAKVTG